MNLTINNTHVDPKTNEYVCQPPAEKTQRKQGWNKYPIPACLTKYFEFFLRQRTNFCASKVTAFWLCTNGKALSATKVSENVQLAAWVLGHYTFNPLDIRRNMLTLMSETGLGDAFVEKVACLQGTSLPMVKGHYNIRFNNEQARQTMVSINNFLG